jgi:hypothetical protein
MRGTGVGSAYKTPSTVIPHSGKVGDDIAKSQSEVASHVLQDDEAWSKRIDGSGNIGVEVSDIILALPSACMGEWLARIPAGEDVDRFDLRPVNFRYVAKIPNAGMQGFEYPAGCRFDL